MRTISLLLVAAVFVGCAEAAAPSPTPTTHTIIGTFTLHQAGKLVDEGAGTCSGTGGYADVRDGVEVTVKDESGTLLGTGALDSVASDIPTACEFVFRVAQLPDAAFYSIEVGRRGDLSYSLTEMERNGWFVSFTLGD